MSIKEQCENLRVILVDDSVLMRNILTGYLSEYGIKTIKSASDGQSAIHDITIASNGGQPFDIVFLDWNMPGLSGFDVLNHFRAKKEFDSMAIVMVTAENKQKSVLEAIRAGATGYMIKPVSKEDLDAKLPQVVGWLQRNKRP